jgi:hypothetical protein
MFGQHFGHNPDGANGVAKHEHGHYAWIRCIAAADISAVAAATAGTA